MEGKSGVDEARTRDLLRDRRDTALSAARNRSFYFAFEDSVIPQGSFLIYFTPRDRAYNGHGSVP